MTFILLEKIYNNQDIDWNKELSKFGINMDINNIINNINLFDFIKIFSNNIYPKYKGNEQINLSESDINQFDETDADYYSHSSLPIIYQKYNKNNIHLELETDFDKFINNDIRKLKLNRRNVILNENIKTTIKFHIKNEYIVYHLGGDINENNSGHIIIKLKLPEDFLLGWG